MNQILSDKEIWDALGYDHPPAELYIADARKVIAAYEAKLNSAEPVAETSLSGKAYMLAKLPPHTKLYTHPCHSQNADCATQVPDGYQLVPIEPTENMVHAGHVISSELMDASLSKSMHHLGGYKTWKELLLSYKYSYLCEQYASGNIDSTQAIYKAMLAAANE